MNSREALMVVLSRRQRTRSEQKRVEERYNAGKCLNKKPVAPGSEILIDCEEPTMVAGSDKRIAPRGCCSACYQAWIDFLKTLPPEKAAQADQEAIARGWILAPQEQRALKSQYAFQRLVS